MKSSPYYVILLILFVFALAAVHVQAQEAEAPRYNFGSGQVDNELAILPGSETSTKLYFFNIGNRNTYISLSAAPPAGWQVTFAPAEHIIRVKIGEQVQEVIANIYVEPSERANSAEEIAGRENEFIKTVAGYYIEAKPVEITIKAPASAKLGSSEQIKISATARWLGQEGSTIAFQQGREFNYNVKVVSSAPAPPEKVIEQEEQQLQQQPAEQEQAESNATQPRVTGLAGLAALTTNKTLLTSLIVISIIILLIIIALIVYIFYLKAKVKAEVKGKIRERRKRR